MSIRKKYKEGGQGIHFDGIELQNIMIGRDTMPKVCSVAIGAIDEFPISWILL